MQAPLRKPIALASLVRPDTRRKWNDGRLKTWLVSAVVQFSPCAGSPMFLRLVSDAERELMCDLEDAPGAEVP